MGRKLKPLRQTATENDATTVSVSPKTPFMFTKSGTGKGEKLWSSKLKHLFTEEEMLKDVSTKGKVTPREERLHKYYWGGGKVRDPATYQAFSTLHRDGQFYPWLPSMRNEYFELVKDRLVTWAEAKDKERSHGSHRESLSSFEYAILVSWERFEQSRLWTEKRAHEDAEEQRKRVQREAVAGASGNLPRMALGTPEHSRRPATSTGAATYGLNPTPARSEGDDSDELEDPSRASHARLQSDNRSPSPPRDTSGTRTSDPTAATTTVSRVLTDLQAKKNMPPPMKVEDAVNRAEVTKYLKKLRASTDTMENATTADITTLMGPVLPSYIDRTANQFGRGPTARRAWADQGRPGSDPSWRALAPKEMYELLTLMYEPDQVKRSATSVLELLARVKVVINIAEPEEAQPGLHELEKIGEGHQATMHLADKTGWGDDKKRLWKTLAWNVILGKKGPPGVVNPAYSETSGHRQDNVRMELWKRMEEQAHQLNDLKEFSDALYAQLYELARDWDRLGRLGFIKGSNGGGTTDQPKPTWCRSCKEVHAKGAHTVPKTEKPNQQGSGRLNLDKRDGRFSKKDLKRMEEQFSTRMPRRRPRLAKGRIHPRRKFEPSSARRHRGTAAKTSSGAARRSL